MPSSASDSLTIADNCNYRLVRTAAFLRYHQCLLVESVVSDKQYEKLIERLGLLVVDQNQYMRKLTRMMLMNIGAKSIYEAADGLAALDVVRAVNPDVMLLDWEVPVLSGPQIMHIVRSPGLFASDPFHHHAHDPGLALARQRGDAARRERGSGQADFSQDAARSPALDPDEAAPDGAGSESIWCRSRAGPLAPASCCRRADHQELGGMSGVQRFAPLRAASAKSPAHLAHASRPQQRLPPPTIQPQARAAAAGRVRLPCSRSARRARPAAPAASLARKLAEFLDDVRR